MAVTQKSKIQVRRGRRENLPQLSAGEFGWAVDTQQLFIGNGTFEEGAASEGNTEILTAVSSIPEAVAGVFASTTLTANTSAEILRFSIAAFPAGVVNYSMTRAGDYRVGMLQFAYKASTSDVDILDLTTGGTLGSALSAAVVADQLILSHTTDNAGPDITFKYKRVDFQ